MLTLTPVKIPFEPPNASIRRLDFSTCEKRITKIKPANGSVWWFEGNFNSTHWHRVDKPSVNARTTSGIRYTVTFRRSEDVVGRWQFQQHTSSATVSLLWRLTVLLKVLSSNIFYFGTTCLQSIICDQENKNIFFPVTATWVKSPLVNEKEHIFSMDAKSKILELAKATQSVLDHLSAYNCTCEEEEPEEYITESETYTKLANQVGNLLQMWKTISSAVTTSNAKKLDYLPGEINEHIEVAKVHMNAIFL